MVQPGRSSPLQFETSEGRRFEVGQVPCVIGRSPACSLQLASPEVSRRHAVILRDGREWWIADCGSRGGTWLNGTRIATSARLNAGDWIGIGLASLKFLPGAAVSGQRPAGRLLDTTIPGDLDWLRTHGTAVLWVAADGRIPHASPVVAEWLAMFFEGAGDTLPAGLVEWLGSGGTPTLPYERRIGSERLRIEACATDDGGHLLVLRRLEPALGVDALRSLGLTQAEAEIVPWLVRGKRNEEIARILGISKRTVEKQVASVLDKLHVETRTAAAWTLIERSGAHG